VFFEAIRQVRVGFVRAAPNEMLTKGVSSAEPTRRTHQLGSRIAWIGTPKAIGDPEP